MTADRDCRRLAALNMVVALLCLLDLAFSPSLKALFACLAWCGSTYYWVARGGIDV